MRHEPNPTSEDIEALCAEAASAGDVAQVEVCQRALEGDADAIAECGRVIESARAMDDDRSGNLFAEYLADGWSVVDPAGGRWWPDDDAREEIERAEDPGSAALRICRVEPMRGRWHS